MDDAVAGRPPPGRRGRRRRGRRRDAADAPRTLTKPGEPPTRRRRARRRAGLRATSRAGRDRPVKLRPRRGRRARPRGHLSRCRRRPRTPPRSRTAGVPDARRRGGRRRAAALAELRRVDVVDGQPVDVRGALRGARGDDLDVRLRKLEASVPEGTEPLTDQPAGGGPRGARRGSLPGDTSPRPFRSFFEWLGELVPDFDWLSRAPPGGRLARRSRRSSSVLASCWRRAS